LAVVGFADVPQQIPDSDTSAPPLLLITGPDSALATVIPDRGIVDTVARTISLVVVNVISAP